MRACFQRCLLVESASFVLDSGRSSQIFLLLRRKKIGFLKESLMVERRQDAFCWFTFT